MIMAEIATGQPAYIYSKPAVCSAKSTDFVDVRTTLGPFV